jgi:3-dehydroquinate dehydratase II
MAKILLIQGANMCHLGKREPQFYGTTTAAELDAMVLEWAKARGVMVEIYYTNVEGEAINRIYRALDEGFDGLLMNPAGFTHAGYALRDCIKGAALPYVEVHVTNIEKREIKSALGGVAEGVVAGFGTTSYRLGLDALIDVLERRRKG